MKYEVHESQILAKWFIRKYWYYVATQFNPVSRVGIAEHMVVRSLCSVDFCWSIPVSKLVDFLRPIYWLGNSRAIPAIWIRQGNLGQQNLGPSGEHNWIRYRNSIAVRHPEIV